MSTGGFPFPWQGPWLAREIHCILQVRFIRRSGNNLMELFNLEGSILRYDLIAFPALRAGQ